MKYRAVVFDFYGVIGLNGWQDFKLLHFDGRWDDWEPLRQLGQLVDSGLASEDEFVEAIDDATGESTEVLRRQFAQTDINLELLDFIEQKIKPHYKVGLLSNASFDVVSALLPPEQIALFNVVLMSASLGLTKPDPSDVC